MSSPSNDGDFSIDISDDVIAAALAAVERPAVTPTTGADLEGLALVVDVEGEGSDDAVLRAELERTREELARVRFRLDEATFSARRAEHRASVAEARVAEIEAQGAEVRQSRDTLAADFERLRARGRRDAEEAERKGEERALAVLLELVDNLSRACTHATANPETVADGLRMLDAQLKRGLARLGLERVDASRGTVFDPEVHDAVARVTADVAEGAVVDEVASGFRIRGRLLRAARVTVAGAPSE